MTHLKHPHLSGLARNPAAGEGLLIRLAAHDAGRHGLALRPGRLPDGVVAALLTHGDAHSAALLHGDRVSPAMRRGIAAHPDPELRDAFPNFVRHLVDRRVVFDIGTLEEAYGAPRTVLVADPDPKLRVAVALTWHDRPASAQLALLGDPDPEVRAAAIERRHPGVPPEWYDRCLADPATRVNAARSVPLTQDRFDGLMDTEDADVRRAVAENPHLSADMVTRLLGIEDSLVRAAVAQSRHVDAETRARLYARLEADSEAGDIDADLALNWHPVEPGWLRDAPLAEKLTHLDCPHPVFRRVLASCRDLPAWAWQRLDADPVLAVRRAAARRPDTPPDVLERLVRAHGDVSHIRPTHVDHPNFPRHVLRTYADEPDPRLRRLALKDPDLPPPTLHRPADDADSHVRSEAARHPRTPAPLLERLLHDPEPGTAEAAAAHPALPPDLMHRILTDARL
ncbi:hypothetical protein ACIQNG_06110 [Streptomyces sp. NPDC091377]|uniref:hypothetical protein n=1 Tax=Streptomyces sp. NPDC091377 TaxID=3365995 RepID=UPI0037F158E6